MGPALPASHGPRRWDVGQAPCERRPDTRWSGRAPPREQRGRSQSRPADRVRTEEITLDTVNPIQGGPRSTRPATMPPRVRLDGAHHQWRKVPSGELSIDPEADERLGRATGRVEAS